MEYTSDDGRCYYWNAATGTTQWEKPEDANILQPTDPIPSVQVVFNQTSSDLFVFHLPTDWNEAELKRHFEPFGNVTSVKVILDRETGQSRGFGFVGYEHLAEATIAMQNMNGYQVGGKRLKVSLKKENR